MRVRETLCAALIALSVVGFAQGKVDDFDAHASNLRLLEDKRVQKEVGVTEAQRAKMNKHADAFRKQLDVYGKELKAKGQDPKQMKRPDAKMNAIMTALKRNVYAELKPPQLKRLREISLQTVGLVGILDVKVATRVGLSDPQVKQLRQLYATGSKQADVLIKKEVGAAIEPFRKQTPKTPEEKKKLQDQARAKVIEAEKRVAPQVEKIRADTRNKMLTALTKKQKDAFLALQGTKFNPA